MPDNADMSLRRRALDILLEPDPALKAEQARALHARLLSAQQAGEAWLSPQEAQAHLSLNEAEHAAMPGRPPRPHLVPAKDVPSRSPFTLEGRAALLHAICHIEFNAIKNVFLVSKLPIHPLKWTIGR